MPEQKGAAPRQNAPRSEQKGPVQEVIAPMPGEKGLTPELKAGTGVLIAPGFLILFSGVNLII